MEKKSKILSYKTMYKISCLKRQNSLLHPSISFFSADKCKK